MGRNESNLSLMLNDYNTEIPGKRANVLRIVQDVHEGGTGADIDGVGHQLHLLHQCRRDAGDRRADGGRSPARGLVNHVTELDVSIYDDPGTCYSQRTIPPCIADYGASPPQSVLSDQARLYRALFNAFNRPSVTSVTLWGISDGGTWLNYLPRDAHQPAAAVRYGRRSEVGLLGGGGPEHLDSVDSPATRANRSLEKR